VLYTATSNATAASIVAAPSDFTKSYYLKSTYATVSGVTTATLTWADSTYSLAKTNAFHSSSTDVAPAINLAAGQYVAAVGSTPATGGFVGKLPVAQGGIGGPSLAANTMMYVKSTTDSDVGLVTAPTAAEGFLKATVSGGVTTFSWGTPAAPVIPYDVSGEYAAKVPVATSAAPIKMFSFRTVRDIKLSANGSTVGGVTTLTGHYFYADVASALSAGATLSVVVRKKTDTAETTYMDVSFAQSASQGTAKIASTAPAVTTSGSDSFWTIPKDSLIRVYATSVSNGDQFANVYFTFAGTVA
jgi:hypothetical protein